MAQVPVINGLGDGTIDYTPGSAVTGGDVVVLNGLVGVATADIASGDQGALSIEGRKKVPKTTAAWVAGLPVFWNATGDPDNGTAASGAANQIGIGVYMGVAAIAAASGDDYGWVVLNVPASRQLVLTVAAAGSTIADAAQLGYGINVVSGADGTKGVILPVAIAGGQPVLVKGTTAGVLKVYPQSGAVINALSASAAISLTTGAMPVALYPTASGQWYTFPLVAS